MSHQTRIDRYLVRKTDEDDEVEFIGQPNTTPAWSSRSTDNRTQRQPQAIGNNNTLSSVASPPNQTTINGTSQSTSFTVRQAKVVARSLKSVVDADKSRILIDRVEKITHGMYWRSRFLQYHLLRLLADDQLPDNINKIEWVYHALACNDRWGKAAVNNSKRSSSSSSSSSSGKRKKQDESSDADDDSEDNNKKRGIPKPIQNEHLLQHLNEWNERFIDLPLAQLSLLKWQGPQEWVYEMHSYGTMFKNYHTYALRSHHATYLAKKYDLKKATAKRVSEHMFHKYKGRVLQGGKDGGEELVEELVEDDSDNEEDVDYDYAWFQEELEYITSLKTLAGHIRFHYKMLVDVSRCEDPITWAMVPLTQYKRRFIRIDKKGAGQLKIIPSNGELSDVFKRPKVTKSLGDSFMTDGLQIHIMYTKDRSVTVENRETNKKKRQVSEVENDEKKRSSKRVYKPKIQDQKYKFKTTYEPGTFNLDDDATTIGLYGVKTLLSTGREDGK